MARSKRSLLSALLSVGLIAGLLAVTQVPASAQVQPSGLQQYMPDMTAWTGTEDGTQLSDKQDGTDTAAHLTAVATNDADRTVWYVCPDTVDEGAGAPADPADDGLLTATELASCEEVARDAEPRTPTRSGPGSQIDEAYDGTWNITAAQEGNRDILALACIGTGERVEGSNLNCTQDLEENIFVDNTDGEDVSTGTTAGEIVSYSTAGGAITTGLENPAASTFNPFPHGSSVPDDGFVFRATTSPEVTALNYIIDDDTEGALAPEGFTTDTDSGCTQIASSLTSKTWRCNVLDGEIPVSSAANGEHALGIVAMTGQVGACGAECILDVHYIVSGARGTVTAIHTFVTNANTNNACASPDKDETNVNNGQQRAPSTRDVVVDTAGEYPGPAPTGVNEEDTRGCLIDQFGQRQLIMTPVSFELSGLATAGYVFCTPNMAQGSAAFSGVGGGTLHDHDGDGYYEHCHTNTNTGEASAELDNYGLTSGGPTAVGQPGTATSRFCVDAQNAEGTNSTDPAPVGHGCPDEAVTSQDSITKGYTSVPTHVHLVYENTGDPANPCHTGDQFRETNIGDIDILLACTRDGQDRPATTEQPGGGRLQWSIFPNTSGQQTATRFDCSTAQGSCPPSETDADGEAEVAIESINEGTDQIQVQLFSDLGAAGPLDFVQMRVRRTQETPTTEPPPSDEVRRHDRRINIKFDPPGRRKGGLTIFGRVRANLNDCVAQVPVKIQRRFNKRWVTRKETTTNNRGKYAVEIRNLKSRYRSVAPKVVITQPDGSQDVCRKTKKGKRYRKN